MVWGMQSHKTCGDGELLRWNQDAFPALALDYDGTLATQGVVRPNTIEAIRTVRESKSQAPARLRSALAPLLR